MANESAVPVYGVICADAMEFERWIVDQVLPVQKQSSIRFFGGSSSGIMRDVTTNEGRYVFLYFSDDCLGMFFDRFLLVGTWEANPLVMTSGDIAMLVALARPRRKEYFIPCGSKFLESIHV